MIISDPFLFNNLTSNRKTRSKIWENFGNFFSAPQFQDHLNNYRALVRLYTSLAIMVKARRCPSFTSSFILTDSVSLLIVQFCATTNTAIIFHKTTNADCWMLLAHIYSPSTPGSLLLFFTFSHQLYIRVILKLIYNASVPLHSQNSRVKQTRAVLSCHPS